MKLDIKNKYLLVKKYLEEHSLVESNITSFNNFVERRMQEIVQEISETLPKEEDIEINLGKIRVGKPLIHEADGSPNYINPAEARLRNLTYSAPVYLEVTVKQGSQIESQEVEVGYIPVIVKSNVCNIAGKNKEELEKLYIDPLDPGGYFIINGNERVMVMSEDLAENQPFIERSKDKLMLRLFSRRGSYRIPVSVTDTNEGIIELSFSRFKNIPAIVVLKSLGMTKEADIAKFIGKENDELIVNLYEYANIQTPEDAMMLIAEKTSLQGTKKEILDRVKQRMDSYLLPHIGLGKNEREEKAITLCKLIKQFLIAKENPENLTDKDHYANKRVRLSGDLLADLFRVNLNILIRDIQHSLQKTQKRKKFYSLKTIAKSTLFTHRIESSIATGNWIGERTGVTQNMDKTNYLAILSQLQRVSSSLPGEQENFLARTLHPTHYGRFCPIETPEGTEIGLRKNLAILAKVSTMVELDEKKFLETLVDNGLKRDKDSETKNLVDVFFNGRFIGDVQNYEEFIQNIKKKRRNQVLPYQLSIRYDKNFNAVLISTEIGRVLRPVIIVENGQSKLTENIVEEIRTGTLKWNDLISVGILEYIDAAEEENCLVSLYAKDVNNETTHLEIDVIDLFGTVTSLVPYPNYDQSARLMRGSKTQKQSLGLYAANFLCRVDTDVSILHYPQKPLVRTFVYDTLNVYPSGQNVIVAIMTHEGYNMEDAVILNKASVDRGLARSTYFRPYTSVELKYAGGLRDQVEIPEKGTSGYRTEESYRYLEEDGIVYPEAKMESGEVVIGKTSPPKFLSESREISVKARKEASSVIRQEEKGVIDAIFLTENRDGNRIIQVRTRDQRVPELGDKFATSHGQKGVVGALVEENDMPFTSSGIRPDILFNPHGIPGRMTVGYLLELITGKIGALSGKIMDGTGFQETKVEELEGQLKELGFRYDGKETMYNGITGKLMNVKIYVGTMYYQKLKYMVSNKMHARASGKVTLLTRQPIEGRARGGALRLGEMEQEALVAHGASLLLKERYDSDKVVIHICTKCGYVAVEDSIHKKIYCPMCGSQEAEPVEMSYAFKLLIDEVQGLHLATKFDLKNKYEQ